MANSPLSTALLGLALLFATACNPTRPPVKQAPLAKPSAMEQRLAWHRKLAWPEARCPLKPPFGQDPGIRIHPLGNDRSLIEVTCTLGAYQGNSLLYLRDGNGKARALRFRQFHSPGKGRLQPYTDTLVTGIVQTDPARHAIQVWRKYRGIGDCGQLLLYRITAGRAKLSELRARDCDDRASPIPPERWPRIRPPVMR